MTRTGPTQATAERVHARLAQAVPGSCFDGGGLSVCVLGAQAWLC